MNKRNHERTHKLVGVALFTAIIVVLQLLGAFVRFGPFSISLVLVPIVVGAAVYGVGSGAWLGFVFGVAVLASGDANAFMMVNPLGTVITVLVKGTRAGLLAGAVFALFQKLNRYVAVILSAIVCPVVNTGIFLFGCKLFFVDTIAEWAVGAGFGADVGAYMIFVLVGANFLVEMAVNIILAPVIMRLIKAGKKESSAQ